MSWVSLVIVEGRAMGIYATEELAREALARCEALYNATGYLVRMPVEGSAGRGEIMEDWDDETTVTRTLPGVTQVIRGTEVRQTPGGWQARYGNHTITSPDPDEALAMMVVVLTGVRL